MKWFLSAVRSEAGNIGVVLLLILGLLVFNALVGGYCTEYFIEFWASKAKGVPVDVSFGLCVIIGLFLGEITVPLAILTWVVACFI